MLGFVLYGTTVLLPLMLQTLMGYTALLSGLVLSPGSLFTIAGAADCGPPDPESGGALAGGVWAGDYGLLPLAHVALQPAN